MGLKGSQNLFKQKQPPEVSRKKKCSYKFRKTHRKEPVPESLFSLKKNLWQRCFLVNFAKFLRTPFYRTLLGDCFCFFTQYYLHSLIYTYLHLLVPTYVPLYYYTNLTKLIKYGKYRNYEEIF